MSTQPKTVEQKEPLPACAHCGRDDEGLPMREYTDEGDPSVGYGPITEVLCDECARKLNALD